MMPLSHEPQMKDRAAFIYVHGLFSPPHTWERFSSALSRVIAGEHRSFRYYSPIINLSITSSIPDVDIIARKLLGFVSEAGEEVEGALFMLGQSFGGLVILNYLLICKRERPDLLDRTRLIFLFGTPNSGSDFLRGPRRLYGLLFHNPQERILTAYDRKAAEIQRNVVENFVYGQQSGFRRGLAIRAFVGEKDGIVPLASAISHFNYEIVEGDHSSIIQDVTEESYVVKRTATLVRQALRAPFRYQQSILIESLNPHQSAEIRVVCELQNLLFADYERIREQDLAACLISSYEGSRPYQMECVALYDANEIVGFSNFWYDESGLYVGFICVDGNRTTLQAEYLYRYLREFALERGRAPIFWEVIHPEHSTNKREAKAKIRHFLRLGAKFIGNVSYRVPDMAALSRGQISLVPHLLMVYFTSGSPKFLTRAQVQKAIEAMLTYFYFDWFSGGESNPELERQRVALVEELTKDLPERCAITETY